MPATRADLEALALQQELALHAHQSFQSGYKQPQDKAFRNRSGLFVWLSEQKLFGLAFLLKWRKKEPSATAQLLVWNESSINVQSASQDMDWTVHLDQAAALGGIDTERWVVQ